MLKKTMDVLWSQFGYVQIYSLEYEPFFFFWGSNALILGLEMLFWRLRFGIPLRQDYSREFIMRAAKREVKERGMWILQLRIERSLVLLLRHL